MLLEDRKDHFVHLGSIVAVDFESIAPELHLLLLTEPGITQIDNLTLDIV